MWALSGFVEPKTAGHSVFGLIFFCKWAFWLLLGNRILVRLLPQQGEGVLNVTKLSQKKLFGAIFLDIPRGRRPHGVVWFSRGCVDSLRAAGARAAMNQIALLKQQQREVPPLRTSCTSWLCARLPHHPCASAALLLPPQPTLPRQAKQADSAATAAAAPRGPPTVTLPPAPAPSSAAASASASQPAASSSRPPFNPALGLAYGVRPGFGVPPPPDIRRAYRVRVGITPNPPPVLDQRVVWTKD